MGNEFVLEVGTEDDEGAAGIRGQERLPSPPPEPVPETLLWN